MIKILHIADIHIYNNKRHDEYKKIFNKLYEIVKENKIDVVLIAGDLFENFIDITHEAKLLAGELLNNLSLYSHVRLTIGNHDCRKLNMNRVNSIETICKLINNPKVYYFDKSDFVQDIVFEDIVWVNHSHIEKHVNPWVDIKHERNNDKIYIDVFHDPINGSSNDIGYKFDDKKLRKVSDFQGDILMAGDIHHRQILSPNKAYPGSLIIQNHGESIKNHGGIIWYVDKKNIRHEFFDIENTEYTYVTFRTEPNMDYNNLQLIPVEYMNARELNVRIIWNELSSNDTKENEYKLKKYVYDNYPNTISISIEKNIIYSNLIDGKMLSESIDINNVITQKAIIKEYLNVNNYDKNIIDEILKIDDIINTRLDFNTTPNITWNIEKMWFNNFKSYGDNVIIDWSKLNGITQITGLNQQGKTTILDAICYILYGTTISTQKKEKFGDKRYINTRRNIDYCDGGITIDVNGEKYTIYRITERKVKDNEVKNCTTKLSYYKGDTIENGIILTDEDKIKTQKLLDGVLGTFDDFIRLSLTNADNLNETLSMDRSVFMDSFIRDAGLDIFDVKHNEFKEYKKELNLEKIIIDIELEESKILDNVNVIKDYNMKLMDIEKNISSNNKLIKQLQKEKEELISSLNKIDDYYLNINIVDLNEKLKCKEDDITIKEKNLEKIESLINELPESFDEILYNNVVQKYNQIIEDKNKEDIKYSNMNNNIDKLKTEILYLLKEKENNLNNKKNKYLLLKENIHKEIEKHDEVINDTIKNTIREIDGVINDYENQMKISCVEFENIKNDGVKIREEINKLKSFDKDIIKVCPTCKQVVNDDDIKHIENEITTYNKKLEELYENGRLKKIHVDNIKNKIQEENEKKNELLSKNYTSFNNVIDVINQNTDCIKKLKNDLNDVNKNIQHVNEDLDSDGLKINQDIIRIENDIKKLEEETIVIVDKINKLEDLKKRGNNKKNELDILKEDYKKRRDLIDNKNKLLLDLKDFKIEIVEINNIIKSYNNNIIYIEENNKINELIKEKNMTIGENEKKNDDYLLEKITLNNNINLRGKIIDDIKINMNKFKQQQHVEHVHNTYINIMHRNGIPTFLLKKSIHVINNELFNLLSNVNFNLYFTDNLDLKLYTKDGDGAEINAVTSSGMERTFCSCALKMALRNINVNSKPDFIFFDEVVNRLVGDSVMLFTTLLEQIKKKIDKVIIIEHIHPINYDHVINVIKDDNGISNIDII
jgi:DNA repair exonuclease SbcCD ATPase subunit/DNA repair exonuclease SbcCD nuclease subunit